MAAAILAAAVAFLGSVRSPAARADGDPPAPRKDAAATTIALAKPAYRLAVSPDGARLAVISAGVTAAIVPTDGSDPRELDLTETLPARAPGEPTTLHSPALAVTFTRDGRRVVVLTQRFCPDPPALAADRAFTFEALVFDATTGVRKHRVRLGDPKPIEVGRPIRTQWARLGTDRNVIVALDGDRVLIDREDGARETVDAATGSRQPAGDSLRDAQSVGASATGRATVMYADDRDAASLSGVTLTFGGETAPGTRVEVRRTSDAHRLAHFPWRSADGSLDHASRPALSEDGSTVFVVTADGSARRIEARAASDGALRWRTGDVGGAPVSLLPPRDGLVVVLGDAQLRAFAQATGKEVSIPDPECLTVSAAAPTGLPRVVWVLVGNRAAARVTLPAPPK
jgi:hypothetical protein